MKFFKKYLGYWFCMAMFGFSAGSVIVNLMLGYSTHKYPFWTWTLCMVLWAYNAISTDRDIRRQRTNV